MTSNGDRTIEIHQASLTPSSNTTSVDPLQQSHTINGNNEELYGFVPSEGDENVVLLQRHDTEYTAYTQASISTESTVAVTSVRNNQNVIVDDDR